MPTSSLAFIDWQEAERVAQAGEEACMALWKAGSKPTVQDFQIILRAREDAIGKMRAMVQEATKG